MINLNELPVQKYEVDWHGSTAEVLALLFSDNRKFFDPTDTENYVCRDIKYVYASLALRLRKHDPLEQHIHIEEPHTMFNDEKYHAVWQIGAWRSGSDAREKRKKMRQHMKEVIQTREEVLPKLFRAVHKECGLTDDNDGRKQAFVLAYTLIITRQIGMAKMMYDIDISGLHKDIKELEVVCPEEHFKNIWWKDDER